MKRVVLALLTLLLLATAIAGFTPSGRLKTVAVRFVARNPWLSRVVFNRAFKTSRVPQVHNSFLEEAVRGVEPGKALDVTMGNGRNAVFLSRQGWDVTGFDVSEEALARARDSAQQAQVDIHAVQSTSEGFDYGIDRWDLIVLAYAWAPVSDRAFAARLKSSLKRGGLVVFEHFLHAGPNPVPKEAGAPDPGELPKLFGGFEILRYDELTGVADWEPPVGGRMSRQLVRMVARKD